MRCQAATSEAPRSVVGPDGDHGALQLFAKIRLDVRVVEDPPEHLPPATRLFRTEDHHVGGLCGHLFEDRLFDDEPTADSTARFNAARVTPRLSW